MHTIYDFFFFQFTCRFSIFKKKTKKKIKKRWSFASIWKPINIYIVATLFIRNNSSLE